MENVRMDDVGKVQQSKYPIGVGGGAVRMQVKDFLRSNRGNIQIVFQAIGDKVVHTARPPRS